MYDDRPKSVILGPSSWRNHTRFSYQPPAEFDDIVAEKIGLLGEQAKKMSIDVLTAHIEWVFRVVPPQIIWSEFGDCIEPSEHSMGIGISSQWSATLEVPCFDPCGMLDAIKRDPDLDPELSWTDDGCLVLSKIISAGHILEARDRFEDCIQRFKRGLLDLQREIECYHQSLPHRVRTAILRADLNVRRHAWMTRDDRERA